MSALSVNPVFPIFTDIDGQPLEAGDIYIGVTGLDPITNPINVYWNAALTQLATQPIKTRGGYPLNGAAIGRLYVGSDYSIKAVSRAGNVVYSATAAGDRISSELVTFIQAGSGAVTRTAQAKMRDVVSVLDFGADPTGVADSYSALANAAAQAASSGKALEITGTFKISAEWELSAVKTVIAHNATIVPTFDTGSAVKYVAASGAFIENMKLLGNLTVVWPTQDWTKERTSFYFSNVYNGEFHISSSKATRGLVCIGNNKGVVYNDFYLGDFFNNSVGVWLDSVNASGWCNMNRFHGGFFYGDGNVSGSLYAANAGHIYTATSPYKVNGNVFLYPSLEWGDTTGGFRLARLGGLRNKLFVGYCEIIAGATTWFVISGEQNYFNAEYVPYVIGYDPSISGASNRVDASGATKPWIAGTAGFLDVDGEGTQYVKTNSLTKPAYDLANAWPGGAALRLSDGALDFGSNTDIEGTFTALVSGSTSAGTATYDRAFGTYTKIGKRLIFTISIKYTGHTGTGDMWITNIPFTSNSNVENYAAQAVFVNGLSLTAGYVAAPIWFPNENKIRMYQLPVGGGSATLVAMDANAEIYITGNVWLN